ncbi:hypothetical protein [Stutzerimonas stutzeri]|uniref:hypothetical protein n=1 Tax=Stutzerimonas stutzeri TaxID=316 RepID=UPI001BCF95E5|nr:hypothetical protein [Stutzerimonas stutzeri]
MSTRYRACIRRLLRNGFETRQGHTVIWQAICWDAMNAGADHAVIRPLSTESRAAWVKGVLSKEYPDRSYEAFSYLLADTVDAEQLSAFESMAVDAITRMELAQRYANHA